MKKTIFRVAAATLLCAPPLFTPTAATASDAIYGVWSRDGHPKDKLEFFDCAGDLCAKGILPMPDGSPAPLILRHAKATGPDNWAGDLFNPENSKIYKGKIALDTPTQLTLTGCLVAFLCQSETWTRIAGPTPKAADAKGAHEAGKASDGKVKPGATAKAAAPGKPAKAKPHVDAPAEAPAPGAGGGNAGE